MISNNILFCGSKSTRKGTFPGPDSSGSTVRLPVKVFRGGCRVSTAIVQAKSRARAFRPVRK